MKLSNRRAAIRFCSVCLVYASATICYFLFSHHVHPHGYVVGGMEGMHHGPSQTSRDHLLLYGLALPLALLTVAGLIWPSDDGTHSSAKGGRLAIVRRCVNLTGNGDANVKKWVVVWFLAPLLLIALDGTFHGHNVLRATEGQARRGENLYVRLCLSLQSPAGYAATWALSLFLVPVTKRAPVLDWLRITPVQALAFHRLAGWTSFWCSLLHGLLHARHQLGFLNPQRERTPRDMLRLLLVPASWPKCLATQNPWHVFWGVPDAYPGADEDAKFCRRALVNDTGLASCAAFAILAVTSLPTIRRKCYTLFYLVHIPAAWIMLVAAMWHYQKCSLILVPNIVYYLSFSVPTGVARAVERWEHWVGRRREDDEGALVAATLIPGGALELTFATAQHRRHESSYVRVSCPSVSCLSHPFSTFSRDGLVDAGGSGASTTATRSILLRSKGPFTEGLTRVLFPARPPATRDDPADDDRGRAFAPTLGAHAVAPPPPPPASWDQILLDAYYAGSFDWTNGAIEAHDDVLIVAGGVGIAPFLDLLPALRRRMQAKREARGERCWDIEAPDGPTCIRLHWYCREVGLASYVWRNYLRLHVREAWEHSAACRGRLKIHIHLTSLGGQASAASESGESLLAEKTDFGVLRRRDSLCPVQDVRFMGSLGLRLSGPGLIVVAGTALHWWWYGKLRHSNLIIRSHSTMFCLILAVLISIITELYLRHCKDRAKEYISVSTGQKVNEAVGSMVEIMPSDDAKSPEMAGPAAFGSRNLNDKDKNLQVAPLTQANMDFNFLTVTRGRPCIDTVVRETLEAKKPGVYSCGPRSLLDRVKDSIRLKREDCAFYEEDSEM